jgi:hypothetical protein
MKRSALLAFCVLCLALMASPATRMAAAAAADGDAVISGEFVIDPPTLINLGFEWFISGDDNRNAGVEVSYRKTGASEWKPALPLLRLQGEHIFNGAQLDVVVPNMFAGSVIDLEADTSYEVQFVLADPDGVSGERRKTVTVRTRAEPMPAAGGRVFHVYPPGFAGQKIEPAFEGLMCAYNLTCSGTDWATAGRPRVKPGDTILVHAGVYKYNRLEYTNDPAVNRQLRAVRRQGGGLYLLRRVDVPERRHRDLGGHAVHRRLERVDRQEEPLRRRRRRHFHQLLRLQQFLHRRQLVHRP